MREQFNSVAAKEDVARLDANLAGLATRYGVALDDYARTRYLTEQYNVIVQSEAERRRQCLCEHFPPPCPLPPGDPPYLVPIACVKGYVDGGGNIAVREICLFGCRKQAITWRSANYWLSAYRSIGETWLHQLCCPPKPKPGAAQGYGYTSGTYVGETFTFTEMPWLGDYVRGNVPLTKADQPYVGVTGLTAEDAGAALSKAGFMIAETIDTSDAAALKQFLVAGAATLDERIKDPAPPKPGDEVALLMGEDGKAVGYALKARGGGGATSSAITSEMTRLTAELRSDVKNTLLTTLATVNTDNEKTKSELAAVKAEFATLATSRVPPAITAELTRLTAELTTLRSALTTVSTDNEKAKSELAAVKAEFATLATSRVPPAITAELTRLTAELTTLRGALTTVSTDNEKAKSELAAVKAEFATLATSRVPPAITAELTRLTAELTTLRGALTTVSTDNEKAKSELAAVKAEFATLATSRVPPAIAAELTRLTAELTTLRGALTTVNTDNEKAKSELGNLRTALATFNTNNEKEKSELANLRGALATLNTDNEKAKSELANLRGALASVNTDNEKVRSELAVAKAEFATLATTLRTALPITALPIAPALSAKLMEAGINTVADMANLTPATIKKLDASGVIKADELTKLIALAKLMKGS